MPTYDYICDSCGHEFEAYESIMADPRTDCPECKLPKLRRKIGPGAAILFKGSGFYQTDYRSESYKKAAEADKSAERAGRSQRPIEVVGRLDEPDQERAGQDPPHAAEERVMIRGRCPICSKAYPDRRDRRPALVSLLLRALPLDRPGPLDRRQLRHPVARTLPARRRTDAGG